MTLNLFRRRNKLTDVASKPEIALTVRGFGLVWHWFYYEGEVKRHGLLEAKSIEEALQGVSEVLKRLE